MAKIKKIYAYEIIDSRGFPTIEGKMILDDERAVTTSIPAGTSVGKNEAVELRDGKSERFEGKGVLQAVSYINELIAPKLIGVSPLKQQEVDFWLKKADGTKNKSRLGANTILTISQLFTKGGALVSNQPVFKYVNGLYKQIFKEEIPIKKIPSPIFNIINGGVHANKNLDIQEFQIIPSSSYTFSQAYQLGIEVFHELKKVLEYRNANISIGVEGGYTPNFATNVDALEVIQEAIINKKLKPGLEIFFGLDMAASQFFVNEEYRIKDRSTPFKKDEYIKFILKLLKDYSILVLEDPINEDDWQSWKKLNSLLSPEVYLVGDDLLTTNKERLIKAIKEKACSTVLIKPNQIGTITEALEVINIARKNNFSYIVSHRSGETNDSFIADFAVGVQSEFVKFGAPSRGERVAKYNRLWQIEREELKIK